MLLSEVILAFEAINETSRSDFQTSALRELKEKQKIEVAMYHLNQLLSVCDLIPKYRESGREDQVYSLLHTIEAMAAACNQTDQGLAEEGVKSHMNTYAANTIRKMISHFRFTPPALDEMIKYAQSVEDDG